MAAATSAGGGAATGGGSHATHQPAVMASLASGLSVLHTVSSMFRGKSALRVDLPRIVVVGLQGSGKSAVLQAIIGHRFLPSKHGTCTRCPVQLDLQHLADPDAPWHVDIVYEGKVRPGSFATDDDVRAEIQAITDSIGSGFSESPISVRVFSPNVPSLVLVDLPGVIASAGDVTSSGINEAAVKTMVRKFAGAPNSLILFVANGNDDPATNLALEVLNDGVPGWEGRTIGVLTNLDGVEDSAPREQFLLDYLFPRDVGANIDDLPFPLDPYGWFVVFAKNRDNDVDLTTDQVLVREEAFFRTHPVYKNFADRCGIKYLASRLEAQLGAQIKDLAPRFSAQLRKNMEEPLAEIEALRATADVAAEITSAAASAAADAGRGSGSGSGSGKSRAWLKLLHQAARKLSEDYNESLSPSARHTSSATGMLAIASLNLSEVVDSRVYQVLQADLQAIVDDQDEFLMLVIQVLRKLDWRVERQLFDRVCGEMMNRFKAPCLEAVTRTETVVRAVLNQQSSPLKVACPAAYDLMMAEVRKRLEGLAGACYRLVGDFVSMETYHVDLGHDEVVPHVRELSTLLMDAALASKGKGDMTMVLAEANWQQTDVCWFDKCGKLPWGRFVRHHCRLCGRLTCSKHAEKVLDSKTGALLSEEAIRGKKSGAVTWGCNSCLENERLKQVRDARVNEMAAMDAANVERARAAWETRQHGLMAADTLGVDPAAMAMAQQQQAGMPGAPGGPPFVPGMMPVPPPMPMGAAAAAGGVAPPPPTGAAGPAASAKAGGGGGSDDDEGDDDDDDGAVDDNGARVGYDESTKTMTLDAQHGRIVNFVGEICVVYANAMRRKIVDYVRKAINFMVLEKMREAINEVDEVESDDVREKYREAFAANAHVARASLARLQARVDCSELMISILDNIAVGKPVGSKLAELNSRAKFASAVMEGDDVQVLEVMAEREAESKAKAAAEAAASAASAGGGGDGGGGSDSDGADV